MSKWLNNVNNFLEALDTNVGDAAEAQAEIYDDVMGVYDNLDDGQVGGQSSVDDILAKRGLLENDDDDQEDDDDDEEEEDESSTGSTEDDDMKNPHDVDNMVEASSESQIMDANANANEEAADEVSVNTNTNTNTNTSISKQAEEDNQSENNDENSKDTLDKNGSEEVDTEEKAPLPMSHSNDSSVNANKESISQSAGNVNVQVDQKQQQQQRNRSSENNNEELLTQIAELKKSLDAQKKLTKESNTKSNSAEKETRKLRRNVVKLNAELDSLERELDAQRTELERAAARIDKDLYRYKEEKERMEKSHKEDLKAISDENKASVTAMTAAHSSQISDMEERVKRAEEARAKEGGDMSAELADSIDRERETLVKAAALEEDKALLASQVSSLQTQIAGMDSRAESLQQARDSAYDQERGADEKLDAALSLHARQLGQRQAREAELERNVADLGAALVVARQRETQILNQARITMIEQESSGGLSDLKEKLSSAEAEVDMLNAQVMMERQKAETMQIELVEISEERDEDAEVSLMKQREYDRRVADLSMTINQLQTSQNVVSGGNDNDSKFSIFEAQEKKLQTQISTLSEDLIRQSNKLQNASTEVQTLRNRLKSAISRAEIAESTAQVASNVDIYDVERGTNKMKSKYVRRRKAQTSIRSALKLDPGSGEMKEGLGVFVEAIDNIALSTGNFFRNDPFARAFFLSYLMILHLWAFCLVLFHAHGTLEPSPDVGPEELLRHSYRHNEQASSP